jgi:hypothetical protein
MAHDPKELAFALALFNHRDPKPGEVWVHIKTRGIYTIVCRSLEEATLDPLIVYKRHHENEAEDPMEQDICWTRTLDDFNSKFIKVE